MFKKTLWLPLFLSLALYTKRVFSICNRYPTKTVAEKSPVDEHFAILINNNPQNYILGQAYNVTLNAYNGRRFIAFSLALENENGEPFSLQDLGHFEIIDPVETRYSHSCSNMIESTNTNAKTRIEVAWIAPTDPKSGCVLIRATVLQHRDVWHMDDGGLTRKICQEIVDEVESRKDGQACCACDEARYELTFQGNWNRNLHWKDFPSKGWVTRFGDIIGAAHTADYRFWSDGMLATDGIREYAEHGSTRTLEQEFNRKFQEDIIRTIIKARGPAFPNLNGISVASVRVDPRHHMISLVSKIDPSPDWFLGISGMELCMPNCTWLEERVIKLYPWDAGTDAGPSYTSADQPQVPPDVIRRIRSDYPNDPRSPFHGEVLYPLGTLILKRQRIYERNCEDNDSNNVNIPRECYTHPWTDWTECSVKCGVGRSQRTRVYKQPELAKIFNCDEMVQLREDKSCKGENCFGTEAEPFEDVHSMENPNYNAQCELTEWSQWSQCSKTCGEGTMTRRRRFRNSRSQEACESVNRVQLIDYKKCMGPMCLGELNGNSEQNQDDYDDEFKPNFDGEQQAPDFMENNPLQVGNLNQGEMEVDTRFGEKYRNQYSASSIFNPYSSKTKTVANNFESFEEEKPTMLVPAYCFHKLHVYNCLDRAVVGNFWFYNYCQDECMLFATDRCDANQNKFTSLEACEQMCRRPENEPYLRLQQNETCKSYERRRNSKRRKSNSWTIA